MDSRRNLFKAMAAALLAAAVVLVLFVMPAEYGIDPTGVGGALGLTAIASPGLSPVPPLQGDTLAPTAIGPVSLYPGQYRFDVRKIELGPYEYVEFKYHLAEGAAMLFSWRADAPFTGIHGWYWENLGGDTVTITLHTAGFYTSGHQFNSDRTRETHEVRPIETMSADN
jgi:hypothetical protein